MHADNQNVIDRFLKQESAAGIILVMAALLAIVLANIPYLNSYYSLLIDTPVGLQIGDLVIHKPLLLWINDGLMAVFFFLIGLELKREFMQGELSEPKNIVLPALGALGGMVVPAAIYVAFNYQDPFAIDGWAIPAATDIAFALGILVLLGKRVPVSLKVFLTSLAIFDDVGAIIIIALFYTSKIAVTALIVTAVCIAILFVLNMKNVVNKSVYLFIGVVMWVALLKSGVHATLAGVILAMFIPMSCKVNASCSPVKELEHDLHTVVAFIILPIFAFANAGVTVLGITAEQALHSVPVGIALGLFIGKQIGVFGFCWIGIKMGMADLPKNVSWSSLYGTALLCGVGFTMSLFIGSLAFEASADKLFDERLGIIVGSLVSGVLGYIVLSKTLPKKAA